MESIGRNPQKVPFICKFFATLWGKPKTDYFLCLLTPIIYVFGGPIILIYGFFTKYWLLSVIYVAWMVYDRNTCNNGGRRFEFIRRIWLWRYVANYFPMKLVKTVDLDPSKNYLFCAHPHGVYATSAVINFSTEATDVSEKFPGIRTTFLPVEVQFRFPFHREMIGAFGMASSSARSLKHFLTDPKGGNAAVLCVGGIYEMLDAHLNTYVINLKARKGFVRIALKAGAPLVPIFTFGENELFEQLPNPVGSRLRKIQYFFARAIGLPLVTPTSIRPKRHPVTTVVGAPLTFKKNEQPTEQDVDKLHAKYVEALKELFYSNRSKYGEIHRDLTFI